jgi:hypothetical protein
LIGWLIDWLIDISNRKIIKREKIWCPYHTIHHCLLSWLVTSTSMKVTGVPEKLYFPQW